MYLFINGEGWVVASCWLDVEVSITKGSFPGWRVEHFGDDTVFLLLDCDFFAGPVVLLLRWETGALVTLAVFLSIFKNKPFNSKLCVTHKWNKIFVVG